MMDAETAQSSEQLLQPIKDSEDEKLKYKNTQNDDEKSEENFGNKTDEDKLYQQIEEIKTTYPMIADIWLGYDCKNPGKTCLVCYTSEYASKLPASWNGYPIYPRIFNSVSDEAENVANIIVADQKYAITAERQKALKLAIRENAEMLLQNHSNITVISASPIKSSQGGRQLLQEDCIVIYCRVKGIIPRGENPFPVKIGIFKVDVREGFFTAGGLTNDDLQKSDDYLDPLRIGAQIVVGDTGNMGTLGFFVNLQNGVTGFVTCAHVALTESEIQLENIVASNVCENRLVYQPDVTHCIGSIRKVAFQCNDRLDTSVDAALVELQDESRLPVDGYMIQGREENLRIAGFTALIPPCFCTGKINKHPRPRSQILKCGATTGITTGLLCSEGSVVRMENKDMSFQMMNGQRYEMYNQYDVLSLSYQLFFDIGDSGALVMEKNDDGELMAIGLAIGKTSYNSCIVTPIVHVLNKLGIPQQLSHFGQHKQEQQQQKKRKLEQTIPTSYDDINFDKLFQFSDKEISHGYMEDLEFTMSSRTNPLQMLNSDQNLCLQPSGARPKTTTHETQFDKRHGIKLEKVHSVNLIEDQFKKISTSTQQDEYLKNDEIENAFKAILSAFRELEILFKELPKKLSKENKRAQSEPNLHSECRISSPTYDLETEGIIIRGTKDAKIRIRLPNKVLELGNEDAETDHKISHTEEFADQMNNLNIDNEDNDDDSDNKDL